MTSKDYYRVLKIRWGATPEEVKEAYRRLARQYHPDLNPGDEQAVERLKEINEAYEVLGDPQKQAQYDWLHGSTYQQPTYRRQSHPHYHTDTDLNFPVITHSSRLNGWDLLERFFDLMDQMDEAMEVRWKRFRRSWEDY